MIVKLVGGLGNQMFQYAMGRALAVKYDVPLLLDDSAFASDTLRKFELTQMAISANLANIYDLKQLGISRRNFSKLSCMANRLGLYRNKYIIKEKGFEYDKNILNVAPPVYLDGYWQSERYFSDIAELIRAEFLYISALNSQNTLKLQDIKLAGDQSVSLHVRRGDYITNPTSSIVHGVCSLEYYSLAVRYIRKRVPAPHFFIFSDDHEWVRKNLKIDDAVTYVDINSADYGLLDLNLMKQCRHHVIANSSFSWWGAWLNNSNDKVVVAPYRWFAKGHYSTRDLLPSTWIQL